MIEVEGRDAESTCKDNEETSLVQLLSVVAKRQWPAGYSYNEQSAPPRPRRTAWTAGRGGAGRGTDDPCGSTSPALLSRYVVIHAKTPRLPDSVAHVHSTRSARRLFQRGQATHCFVLRTSAGFLCHHRLSLQRQHLSRCDPDPDPDPDHDLDPAIRLLVPRSSTLCITISKLLRHE